MNLKAALILLGVLLAAACKDSSPHTTQPYGLRLTQEVANSHAPCEVNSVNWTGPKYVYPGQFTYSIAPSHNSPGVGQTCPGDPQYSWRIERGGVATSYPCSGPSCVLTVNSGDASFRWQVGYSYLTYNEGSSTWQTWMTFVRDVIYDHAPFSIALNGPTSVTLGTHTWTATASGSTGSYTYRWEKSSDAGSSWSAVCAAMSSCSLNVATMPSFRLRATVTSSSNNTSSLSRDVTVRLSPTITGPSNLHPTSYCTWYAGSNGAAPFSYTWTGRLNGTGSAISGSISRTGNLMLTVTDAYGRSGSVLHPVEVLDSYWGCMN